MIADLRLLVHIIEKDKQENNINQKRIDGAIKLYNQHETELSVSEKIWVENVLFDSKKHEVNGLENNSKEFISILKNRRSVRRYTSYIPTDKEIKFVVTMGLWAPSSCNRQPLELVVIKDRNKIQELSRIKKQKFIENSPCILLLLADMEVYSKNKNYVMKKYFADMDISAIAQNISLSAHYLDLGTCWVNITPNNIAKIRQLIIFPNTWVPKLLMCFGRPGIQTKPPGRKDIIIYNEGAIKE